MMRLTCGWLLAGAVIGVCPVQAADKPRLTLEQKADKARIDSQRVEQAQLEKARQAAKASAAREERIMQRASTSEWEAKQKQKAQDQFDERETREQRYLREAKEAAAKERQIPISQ
ncbi:hypothetical protein [Shewanella sp.]|uniref:hypothetical protein n=1 Tax=Shewanella sp. TaxID=50422 RepID=UPI003F3CB21C